MPTPYPHHRQAAGIGLGVCVVRNVIVVISSDHRSVPKYRNRVISLSERVQNLTTGREYDPGWNRGVVRYSDTISIYIAGSFKMSSSGEAEGVLQIGGSIAGHQASNAAHPAQV